MAAAIASAAAGLATWPGAARAEEGDVVGLLHVEFDGVSETAAQMLEQSFMDGLGNAGFQVTPRERMVELLAGSDHVESCRFGPCLKTVYAVTGVRLVLAARVTSVGRAYTFVVTLIDTRTGTPTSQAVERCAVCTVDEAVATASLAVIQVVTGLGEAHVVDPTVGPTGGAEALDVAALRAAEARAQARLADRRRRLRRSAWIMSGASVAVGAIGVYYLAMDDSAVAYPALAAGGTLAIAGGTLFYFSSTF
jgi:hypothetical protein